MSRVSSPKPIKGIKSKWSGRQPRTLNIFKIHDSVANAIDEIPKQALYMPSPLRLVWLWRGYLRYLFTNDLVFIPCVIRGSQITFTILDF